MKNNILFLLIFLLFPKSFLAQSATEKTIKEQSKIWTAFISTTKLNKHWDFIADAGTLWSGFFERDNLTILRGTVNYKINPNITVGGGYAHGWAAPTNPEWSTYSDENRFFEQIFFNSKLGNIRVSQRIRNEQRWQEKIVNDKVSDDIRFTNRIRYMANFNIPIFKNPNLPTLVTYDEIMVHFGKEVVYNTFDQNRIFIGFRQNINTKWSYDIGYLNAFQQKYSGSNYEMSHMMRLFIYLNTETK